MSVGHDAIDRHSWTNTWSKKLTGYHLSHCIYFQNLLASLAVELFELFNTC